MASCFSCSSTILFGGIRDRGLRFCSKACHARQANYLASLDLYSDAEAYAEALLVQAAPCPRCQRRGHVNSHERAFVWSLLLYSNLRTETFIGCRACAVKGQATWTIGSLMLDWWALLVGPVFTLAAVAANLAQMVRSLIPAAPRPMLVMHARLALVKLGRQQHADQQDGLSFAMAPSGRATYSDGRIEPVL